MAGNDDQVQRALNEAKREELRQRYGAEFRDGEEALPPEIESRWLHEIEEFERQFDQAAQVSVHHYIGDPPVRPLGTIPPAELPQETDRLLELLRSNSIEICFVGNLSDQEIYRFITEEIFAQEIADIRIDGLTLSFLYEEFHPDPSREAGWAAEDFLRAIFERNESAALSLIADDSSHDRPEYPSSGERLRAGVTTFLSGIAAFFEWRADVIACTVEGKEAGVRMGISWKGLDRKHLRSMSASGDAFIHLRLNRGTWEVSAADIPGLPSP
jgi:hypothetical protein